MIFRKDSLLFRISFCSKWKKRQSNSGLKKTEVDFFFSNKQSLAKQPRASVALSCVCVPTTYLPVLSSLAQGFPEMGYKDLSTLGHYLHIPTRTEEEGPEQLVSSL